MAKTFDQSLDEIARLVKHYQTNRTAFHAPGYKEAHARQNLIDPLFIALDWDVYNAERAAPQYQPVVLEDSLETEMGKKAPDYAFRIGRDPAFFAEAKKPAESIKTNPDHAYQLRRYAWSAKLPLSILTDFEELAVYDCRARPSDKDKVSVGRINYLTFEEYPDRWRELWDVFSYGAVRSGSFDAYAQTAKGKRGTGEVDAEFLKEIEHWRDVLARNIALRNPRLTIDELNDAVQRTIDRLIFLRMAEDRGIEPYGKLLALTPTPSAASPVGKASTGEGSVYAGLIDLCRAADAKYNAGLFDFSSKGDALALKLKVDDGVLKPILAGLYYPQSPYEFSVLPAEILGSVYEQFLGKVIRLTPSHHAKVEEKPEVKKAGGVYYTPAYIVEYIVKNTVGKLVEGKAPKQLEGFCVLDMACGSGSFLLGAYEYLLDYYLQWHIANSVSPMATGDKRSVISRSVPIYQAPDGSWRLTTAEKKRILTAHIFGVDIDQQAAEVTKLSLLLKVLEGESDETLGRQLALFPERALPNLDANIKCGNSLIGPDYFSDQLMPDTEELRRVNPFDWEREFPDAIKAGGFDCVIGNPPYIRMETFKPFKDYLRANYACHDERSDLYAYFIERAHQVLKRGGRFGMIVSNKFLRANYGKPLRDFLNQNAAMERIVDFAGLPVFPGATVRTIVLLTIRSTGEQRPTLYTPPLSVDRFYAVARGSLSVEEAISESTYEVAPTALSQPVWSFAKREADDLMTQLKAENTALVEYCEGQICMGVKSGLTEAFVINEETRAAVLKRNRRAEEIIKLFLNGRDIRRYSIDYKGLYLIYAYHGVDISRYPSIEEHLKPFKSRLQNRATQQAWYELQQPQYNFARYMDGPKIVFPDIATTPRFALDETGYYGANTTYFIPRRDLYLLGLLNSSLGRFYFVITCAGLEGKTETYLRFFGQYLEGFPVRPINFSDPADKARHDKMVSLVEQMLDLHKRLASTTTPRDREVLQRQIDATDRQIDALVYELYGLTEDEIRIVEGD
ncbi:MAG TPA: N-6 DNA methylase [Anaerolineae bacterium]|nr:N-6 DNA methylase [Anaerolineae bacterium]